MLRRLATAVVSHPRLVLVSALAFVVLAGVLGGGVVSQLKVGGFDDPSSESSQAQQLLDSRFAGSPSLANLALLVTARTDNVDAPKVAAAGKQVAQRVQAEPDVTSVMSYWSTKAPDLRSRDGRSALVLVHVGGTPEQATKQAKKIIEELAAQDDGVVQVRAGGPLGVFNDINTHVEDDLKKAESIAIPATLVLLIVAFGSVVAALMPLAIGMVAIVSTLLVLFVLDKITDVSVYASNVATAFGLGLAIDFGLLMVSRFREERDAGHDPRQAVIEAVVKAGRTILFSAATVSVAMCGMLVFPLYFLRSIAFAAIAVVVVAALSAVVVLPALLALLGPRVDSLALYRRRNTLAAESRFWRRSAAAVMRRPVLTALPVIALLLAMGMPLLHATFATPDERALPTDAVARQVTTAIRTDFPTDSSKALTVTTPYSGKTFDGLAQRISTLDHVSRVDGASGSFVRGKPVAGPGPQSAQFSSGQARFMLVHPAVDSQSEAAQDLVRGVRALTAAAGTDINVGGPTAALIDSRSAITDRLGAALGLMAVATFILLFLFTGSVVLPLKALAMNALLLCAVLGSMVWLFQDGHLIDWFGTTPTPMNTAMAVLLCCISFGLSVDYEMFLLSRIKEAHDAGADSVEAVIEGLGRVGRIVSSAAALLTVTLFSFATGLSFMQMFGLGAGLAVLLDAILIRGVLVPAFMRIAGEANWWAPRPLRWLHARIGLTEAPSSASPAAVALAYEGAAVLAGQGESVALGAVGYGQSPAVGHDSSMPSQRSSAPWAGMAASSVVSGPGGTVPLQQSAEPLTARIAVQVPQDAVPSAYAGSPTGAVLRLAGQVPPHQAPQHQAPQTQEGGGRPEVPLILDVVEGPIAGARVIVDSAELVLGRKAQGTASLGEDVSLSRRHAVLRWTGEGHVVEDLGSTNGTFVNQERISGPTHLGHGDELSLGMSRLVVIDFEATAIGLPAVKKPVPAADGSGTISFAAASPDRQLAQARTLYDEHRLAESEHLFTQLAKMPAFAAESFYGLGLIRIAVKDLPTAQRLLLRCIELNPAHADALYQLGAIVELRGEMATAPFWYEHAIRVQPGHPLATQALARVRGRLQEDEQLPGAYA